MKKSATVKKKEEPNQLPTPTAAETPAVRQPGEYKIVSRAKVRPDPNQPRKDFAEEPLEELAWSIREHGIQQPLVVQLVPGLQLKEPDMIEKNWRAVDAKGATVFEGGEAEVKRLAADQLEGFYQIIFGERRWRASAARAFERNGEKIKWPGLGELPVIVREITEKDRFVLQFIENNHRANLTALEEAKAFQEQLEKRKAIDPTFNPEKLGDELGIKRSTIYNRLKLLRLHEPVRQALVSGKIEVSVAAAIAAVPEVKKQEELLAEVVQNIDWGRTMSFRDVEETIDDEYARPLKDGPFDREDAGLVPIKWSLSAGTTQVVTESAKQPSIPHPATIGVPKLVSAAISDPDPAAYGKFYLTDQNGFQMLGPVPKAIGRELADFLTSNAKGPAIVVGRYSGGACTDCPHRSGVINPESKSPNVCTLTSCFDAKLKAHWGIKAQELRIKGKKVYTEGELRKLGKHVAGDAKQSAENRYGQSWKELMGKHAPEPALVATKEGIEKFYPAEEAKAAAKKNGVRFYSNAGQSPADREKENAKRKEKEERRERRRKLANQQFDELTKGIATVKDADAWEILAPLVQGRWLDAGMKKLIAKTKSAKARALLAVLGDNDNPVCDWDGDWDKDLLATWKRLGVDLEAEDAKAAPELKLEKAEPKQKELLAVRTTKKKKGGGGKGQGEEAEVSRPNV